MKIYICDTVKFSEGINGLEAVCHREGNGVKY